MDQMHYTYEFESQGPNQTYIQLPTTYSSMIQPHHPVRTSPPPNVGNHPTPSYPSRILLALQAEAIGPQCITRADTISHALVLRCFHMGLLGKGRPFTSFAGKCRQGAGARFGIVADGISETEYRLRAVFAFARSKEQGGDEVDPNGARVGHRTRRVRVSVDKDFVLTCRWRCHGESERRE